VDRVRRAEGISTRRSEVRACQWRGAGTTARSNPRMSDMDHRTRYYTLRVDSVHGCHTLDTRNHVCMPGIQLRHRIRVQGVLSFPITTIPFSSPVACSPTCYMAVFSSQRIVLHHASNGAIVCGDRLWIVCRSRIRWGPAPGALGGAGMWRNICGCSTSERSLCAQPSGCSGVRGTAFPMESLAVEQA
jgi:hypothetical protein